MHQGFSKVFLHSGLNAYRNSWRGFRFVASSFLVYYKSYQTKSISCTDLIFPITFIKVCPITIQNNMCCWGIEIKKKPKYKINGNIEDLPNKNRFDIIATTLRKTIWLCCVHIPQLMTHSGVYTLPPTLQLCYKSLGILRRVTTSQEAQISGLDVLQKLHNTDFIWHRFRGFPWDRLAKQEFRHSPIKSLRTIKSLFPEIWESIHHIKWRGGRKLCFPYQDTF